MRLVGPSKIIIFASFTRMLDLLSEHLLRLNGEDVAPLAGKGPSGEEEGGRGGGGDSRGGAKDEGGSDMVDPEKKKKGSVVAAHERDENSSSNEGKDALLVSSSSSSSSSSKASSLLPSSTPLGQRNAALSFQLARLDGSMSQRQREANLANFRLRADTPILLMSLKAGALGLNLTEANVGIIFDPWWNYAVESQAISRMHRMGQTRPVYVKRLIVSGTIEDAILEIQRKKARIARHVLSDDAVQTEDAKLNEEDIRKFFKH